MTNYTIKTKKLEEGIYNHNLFDDKGNLMKDEDVLANGLTVKDTLFYHGVRTVPFMRQIKVDSLESTMEIKR